jgi:Na+/proline symporter
LFIVREMPHGLAGLVLAALFAVAMSNASGSLNSLAASSVLDFERLRGPDGPRRGRSLEPAPMGSGPTRFLARSRRATLAWGAVLLVFGLFKWGPVLEAGLTIASLPFGALLGLFLLGTIDRRSTARGALAGMFAGLTVVLLVYGFTRVAFTWYVLIGSGVTVLVGALLSRLANSPRSGAHQGSSTHQ